MNRYNRYMTFFLVSTLPTAAMMAQEDNTLVAIYSQPAQYQHLQEYAITIHESGENTQSLSSTTFQKEKVIEKVFAIQANQRLKIDNRYGKITIKNWARNEVQVTIRVRTAENSERRAQEALDRVRIAESKTANDISFQTTISSGDSNWWSSLTSDGGDRSLSIDYVVYMPKSNVISLNNRYGAIELDDRDGKVDVSVSYGSLSAGRLNGQQNALDIAYSKANMAYVNEGDIEVRYGGLTLTEAEKISLSLSYASGTKIGKVNREAAVSLRYSGGFQMGLAASIKKADVSASYSNVEITPDGKAAFNFEVAVSYGGFDYDRNLTSIGSESGGNNSKSYTGYWNKRTNNAVHISSKYGSVSLK